MKISKIAAIVALVFATVFTACKKDKTEVLTTPAMHGLWSGKTSIGNVAPSTYLRLRILGQGFLSRLDADENVLGLGSWEMTGTNFTGFYQLSANNATISLQGTYNENNKTITGTWGYAESTTNGGNFYVNKEE